MVDFILTMIFIFTVLCIWLLRYWRFREIEKLENASQEEKKAVVTIVSDELTNVRINNESVNVQIQSATQSPVQNNTYPDSDIETTVPLVASNTNSDSLSYDASVAFTDDNGNDIYEEKPVEIIVGDEIPTNDELVNKPENKVIEDVSEHKTVLDPSIDYTSISDYFQAN